MTPDCITVARIFVACVVVVWALALYALYRWTGQEPVSTKPSRRWWGLLLWSAAALAAYATGEALIADPANVPSFTPASVAACVAETWSARWIAADCLIMVLMYVGLAPFIRHRSDEARHPSATASAAGGLFLGVVCIVILTQFALPFVASLLIVAIVVSIIVLLVSRAGLSDESRFRIRTTQRGLVGVLGMMWPTVIMPVASIFTAVLAMLVFVISLTLLFKTVVGQRLRSIDG